MSAETSIRRERDAARRDAAHLRRVIAQLCLDVCDATREPAALAAVERARKVVLGAAYRPLTPETA